MSDKALIDAMAEAMATKEGFYVTEKQARQRGIKWPTIAQKCCNPGNIRAWQDAQGRWYPTTGGLGPMGDLGVCGLRGVGAPEVWQSAGSGTEAARAGRGVAQAEAADRDLPERASYGRQAAHAAPDVRQVRAGI